MKKFALLLLIFALFSCKKDSDAIDENNNTTPIPKFLLPEDEAVWITCGLLTYWPEGVIRATNEYRIGDDTVINGTIYSTLKKYASYVYDYDANIPNDTSICEGFGSIYRQDKATRKIYYPIIQNSTFQKEELFMDFGLGIGDTLYHANNIIVTIYDTSIIDFGGESLKLIKWARIYDGSWVQQDSGFILQAYDMPFNFPTETCICTMPGTETRPVFISKGDTLRFEDIE